MTETVIPEDAHAIIVSSDGQITGVYPETMKDEQVTPVHMLMLGIIMHMHDKTWAQSMIDHAAEVLKPKVG